jgi:hypothetical protein
MLRDVSMPVVSFNAPHRRCARKKLGPYSRVHHLASVDGRSQVGRYVRQLRRQLSEHVGGSPSVAQRVLIEQATIKAARLGLLVDKILTAAEPDVDLATRCYLAWSNSLRRDLEALGLDEHATEIDRLRRERLEAGLG